MGYDIFATLPEWQQYPILSQNSREIVKLFNLHYECKYIGYDIYGQFYRYLRLKFNEIAPGYSVLYDKYKNEESKLMKVGDVTSRDYNELSTVSSSQSLSSNASSNLYDTPKTNLPNELNHPSSINTNDGTSNSSDETKGSLTRNEVEEKVANGYLNEVNKFRQSYLNLDNEFVKEFSNLFLGTIILW